MIYLSRQPIVRGHLLKEFLSPSSEPCEPSSVARGAFSKKTLPLLGNGSPTIDNVNVSSTSRVKNFL